MDQDDDGLTLEDHKFVLALLEREKRRRRATRPHLSGSEDALQHMLEATIREWARAGGKGQSVICGTLLSIGASLIEEMPMDMRAQHVVITLHRLTDPIPPHELAKAEAKVAGYVDYRRGKSVH